MTFKFNRISYYNRYQILLAHLSLKKQLKSIIFVDEYTNIGEFQKITKFDLIEMECVLCTIVCYGRYTFLWFFESLIMHLVIKNICLTKFELIGQVVNRYKYAENIDLSTYYTRCLVNIDFENVIVFIMMNRLKVIQLGRYYIGVSANNNSYSFFKFVYQT